MPDAPAPLTRAERDAADALLREWERQDRAGAVDYAAADAIVRAEHGADVLDAVRRRQSAGGSLLSLVLGSPALLPDA